MDEYSGNTSRYFYISVEVRQIHHPQIQWGVGADFLSVSPKKLSHTQRGDALMQGQPPRDTSPFTEGTSQFIL